MVEVDVPINSFQVLNGMTVFSFNFCTVRQYGRVGAMLAADSEKFYVIKLAKFEQDVVYSGVGIAGQQNGLAKTNGQSY